MSAICDYEEAKRAVLADARYIGRVSPDILDKELCIIAVKVCPHLIHECGQFAKDPEVLGAIRPIITTREEALEACKESMFNILFVDYGVFDEDLAIELISIDCDAYDFLPSWLQSDQHVQILHSRWSKTRYQCGVESQACGVSVSAY